MFLLLLLYFILFILYYITPTKCQRLTRETVKGTCGHREQ